jgi:excisionase family DNA binding protein
MMGVTPMSTAPRQPSLIVPLVPARPVAVPWPVRIQKKIELKRTVALAPQPGERLTVSVAEAADLLGISRRTAYELVKAGEIPSLKLRQTIRVPYQGLVEMIEAACAAHRGIDQQWRSHPRNGSTKTDPKRSPYGSTSE